MSQFTIKQKKVFAIACLVIVLSCASIFQMMYASTPGDVYELIDRGETYQVMQQLRDKSQMDKEDAWHRTPLLYAIQNRKFDIASKLIAKGADVNKSNSNGISPLIAAIQKNNMVTVKELVEAGADTNQADKMGNTPILWACKRGDDEIATYLLSNKANPNIANHNQELPATFEGRMSESFKELLRYSILLNESVKPTVAHAAEQPAEYILDLFPIPVERYVLGTPQSPVTIIEYTDFECPYCQQSAVQLEQAISASGKDVALIIKHHPLRSHPNALPAAIYYEMLLSQNKKAAYDYYMALMRHPENVATHKVVFDKIWDSMTDPIEMPNAGQIQKRIETDTDEAFENDLAGVPVFIINKHVYKGYMSKDMFLQAFDKQ